MWPSVTSARRRSLVVLAATVAVLALAAWWLLAHYSGLPPLRSHNPVRVAVAGGCPVSTRAADGVANPDSTGLERLVPPGPTGGLVCRYTPIEPAPGGQLAHRVVMTPAQATRIATDLDAIDDSGGGDHSCPADWPAYDVLVFSYADREDVDVWYERTACGGADNGYVMKDYLTAPVVAEFEKLATDLGNMIGT